MIKISGATGIDMNGTALTDASQIDSVLINENGVSVATTTDVGTANSSLVKTALNATGTAPIYACRAWVNFNGTGTVAIRASGNVSSITDNGVGDYTVNFTTAMPDANYSSSTVVGSDLVFSTATTLTAMTTSTYRFGTVTLQPGANVVAVDRSIIHFSAIN